MRLPISYNFWSFIYLQKNIGMLYEKLMANKNIGETISLSNYQFLHKRTGFIWQYEDSNTFNNKVN
jgi:hypothetical protein